MHSLRLLSAVALVTLCLDRCTPAHAVAPVKDIKIQGAAGEVSTGATLTLRGTVTSAVGSSINLALGTITFASNVSLLGQTIDLASAEVTGLLPWANINTAFGVFDGDLGFGGTVGLVPAPASGDQAAGKFLRANATWAVPTTSFLALTDTPDTYAGQGSKIVAVNGAANALEFVAAAASNFLALTDTPDAYTGQASKLVAVNGAANALEFISPTTSNFLGLTDTPDAYTGAGGKVVAVNAGATALEFITSLADPSTTKGDLLARSTTALSRLAVGANGQVLTADSTASLGVAWAASAGGGADALDLTTIALVEEFVSGSTTSGAIGELRWVSTLSTVTASYNDTPPWGEFVLTSATGSSNNGMINVSPSTTRLVDHNIAGWDSKWRIKFSNTASVAIFFGLGNPAIGAVDTQAGVQFRYDTSAGDTTWQYLTRSDALVTTVTNSTIAPDTGWHTFRMRSTTAGTILFSIDGGTELSIATNLPTVGLVPFAKLMNKTTSARVLTLDTFRLKVTGLSR